MNGQCSQVTVAVALAHTAEVIALQASVTGEEGELIRRTLRNLSDLGHVASFNIGASGSVSLDGILDELRSRFGGFTVDACSTAPEAPDHQSAVFLMPVWPFDHTVGGALAGTGRLLGLDLELVATPSPDGEVGAHLPGRVGRWLIHSRPMF